jgi:hypothetical protein
MVRGEVIYARWIDAAFWEDSGHFRFEGGGTRESTDVRGSHRWRGFGRVWDGPRGRFFVGAE